jgi:ABC-2 type transport system permease protein
MRLYAKYIAIHFKSQMQHKMSFLLLTFGQFLLSFMEVLGVFFLLNRFNRVDDFSLQEVLLSYATVLIAITLSKWFARGFDVFPGMISNGEFDRMLVRPRGIMFQTLAGKAEFTRFGRLIQAVIVFSYAIPSCGVHWSGDKVFTLILMIACGILIFFGLFVVFAAASFFTTEGMEIFTFLIDGGQAFGQYPYSIYGQGVLNFLTYVIPLALFQYYPLLFLLGREESILYMLSPIAGLLFLVPAYVFWRFGLRRYKSTGS